MADVEALLIHKAEGNDFYKQEDYAGAIAAYSKGVALLPDLDDLDEPEAKPPSTEFRKQALA